MIDLWISYLKGPNQVYISFSIFTWNRFNRPIYLFMRCKEKFSRNRRTNVAAPSGIILFRSIGNLRALVPNLTLVTRGREPLSSKLNKKPSPKVPLARPQKLVTNNKSTAHLHQPWNVDQEPLDVWPVWGISTVWPFANRYSASMPTRSVPSY